MKNVYRTSTFTATKHNFKGNLFILSQYIKKEIQFCTLFLFS